MQDYKSETIFITKNLNFIINFKTINLLLIKNYQLIIGIFIYIITQTWLNLGYFILIFSKFFANSLKKYIGIVKQIYCYLDKTKPSSLTYYENFKL